MRQQWLILSNTTDDIAISARGLTKNYRLGELYSLRQTIRALARREESVEQLSLAALAGVDVDIRRGEAVGLVGENGSGKSTLLQIAAGTTVPTAGWMRVMGSIMPLLAVGHSFHFELTGVENVVLYGTMLGIRRAVISSRMEAIASFAELERHMSTPVKHFSTGMLSRLSLAVAMQFPADIYIFDEVLAVVDGEFQQRCLDGIKRLHAQGSTILFVSHNLNQVAEVCERVLWLEGGMLKQTGQAASVLTAYGQSVVDAG